MNQRYPCMFLIAFLALASRQVNAANPQSAGYANDQEGIFWFAHVVDVHIGAGWPETNIGQENLSWLLDEGRRVINPVFIVVGGDLVDGSRLGPTSGQSQEEWDQYQAILAAAAPPLTASFYYDMVGNHDIYEPPWRCPALPWYIRNSFQGRLTDTDHFSWIYETSKGNYLFYGLNTTGECATPLAQCNGLMSDAQINALQDALDSHADSQLSFVFGHQGPTQPEGWERLVQQLTTYKAFYLHGHVHKRGEYLLEQDSGKVVVNQIKPLGKADGENLGVGVVDHNAFIYRVTSTRDPWPMVIITAPASKILENGQSNPWAYKVCKNQVNPVRALVFSPQEPTQVLVKVGVLDPVAMEWASESLWSAQVDTTKLIAGVHPVEVTAWVGDKLSNDAVRVDFYSGSCPMPDGEEPGDADAQDGGLLQDHEKSLDAGKGPDQDETASAQENSSPDDVVDQIPGSQTDSGCGCDAGLSPLNWQGFAAVLLSLFVLMRIRKPW